MRAMTLCILVLSACDAEPNPTQFRWPIQVGVRAQRIALDELPGGADTLHDGGGRLIVTSVDRVLPVPIVATSDPAFVDLLGTYDPSGRGESLRLAFLTAASLARSGRDLHSAELFQLGLLDGTASPLELIDGAESVLVRVLIDADPPCEVGTASAPRSIAHEIQVGGTGRVIAAGPLEPTGTLSVGPFEVSYEIASEMFCAVAQGPEAQRAVE
ncbi:MAG: hypothetical protein HY791_01570 [Deltaproteobacteria bacterium]|nr:hypothetical protein [Deltaproteobacteria bacterium]